MYSGFIYLGFSLKKNGDSEVINGFSMKDVYVDLEWDWERKGIKISSLFRFKSYF